MQLEEFKAAVKPLALAERKIFPLVRRSKRPLKSGWHRAVNKNSDQILTNIYNSFNNHDGCGVGMIVGKEQGLIAIDLDYKHPEAQGFYDQWKDELELGICVKTGNGNHYYFAHPYLDSDELLMTSIGGMHTGVDLIADTTEGAEPRFLVVPPTIHASGAQYQYDNDFGETLADDAPDMPNRLRAFVTDREFWANKDKTVESKSEPKGAEWYADNPHALFHIDPFDDEPIDEGGRNQSLSQIAGKLLHMHSFDENYQLTDLMEEMNEINDKRCDPPLDEAEVDALCASIWKTRDRKEAKAAAKAEAEAKVQEAVTFDEGEGDVPIPASAMPAVDADPRNYTLASGADVISQDEYQGVSKPKAQIGQGITNASHLSCPAERPCPKQEPNKAAIWLLFQPPYKPDKPGHDFNLVKLENSFYQYCDNVWVPVSEAAVRSTIQNNFLHATKAHIGNMISFLSNYLYYPVKSIPFWKNGTAPYGYPQDARKLILFNNGMFDVDYYLRSGGDMQNALKECHPNLFTTIKLRYNFDYKAKCPNWENFLTGVWDSPTSERALALKEWMGHCMIPDTSQHKIGVLHGVSRGGKSTVQNIIQEMIGNDNVASTNLAALSKDHGIYPLVGKSLAVISDAHASRGSGSERALEVIKGISGGDAQQVNQKFEDQYTVKLSARFMIVCNEVPLLRDSGNALLARMLPLRFDRRFDTPERPADTSLTSKLMSEISGIANWAIEGIMSYVARGNIYQSREGVEDVARIKRSLNPIGAFADDLLIEADDEWVSSADLYDAWTEWANDAGLQHTGTRDNFLNRLRIVVTPEREMRRSGTMCWKGVGINEKALNEMLSHYNEDF